MSSIVRVPAELDSFLRLPNPQSLIIRGPPGSGKTMLSLALMESFPGRRVYVSLRVTRASLFSQIPWLEKIPPGQVEIVDAAEFSDQVQRHAPEAESAEALLSEGPETNELEDFLWLPHTVQTAWSIAAKSTPTLMIFDSWDAIVDQYFERVVNGGNTIPTRSEIERILLARMARGNISLVLVLERDKPTILEYQVNGIVETYRQLEEGRLERWLSLPKLRGVAITTDTYPFSLAHGRFAAITATRPGDFYRLEPPAPDPQPDARGLWPGSTDFAEGFGRLRFGAQTHLELGSTVPREISRVILGPVILQTLSQGGRVLLIPPPSLDPEDSYWALREHVSPETLRDQLRVLSTVATNSAGQDLPAVGFPSHKVAWTKVGPPVPIPDDPAFLETASRSSKPDLVVLYLSGLEAIS
ncbi:MAG: hypothetical protein L3J96_04325, partial [Thermoplasmata archaeon]|nr:hypothetical protein [Thermoplasmata archaeon]